MHQDFNEEERELDGATLRKIDIIRTTLNEIIAEMGAPIDPKAIGLLEMAVDMLEEQVIMDKTYEYPDCPNCIHDEREEVHESPPEKPNSQMLFFKNKGPSANDLRDMFDTSWMDNDTP